MINESPSMAEAELKRLDLLTIAGMSADAIDKKLRGIEALMRQERRMRTSLGLEDVGQRFAKVVQAVSEMDDAVRQACAQAANTLYGITGDKGPTIEPSAPTGFTGKPDPADPSPPPPLSKGYEPVAGAGQGDLFTEPGRSERYQAERAQLVAAHPNHGKPYTELDWREIVLTCAQQGSFKECARILGRTEAAVMKCAFEMGLIRANFVAPTGNMARDHANKEYFWAGHVYISTVRKYAKLRFEKLDAILLSMAYEYEPEGRYYVAPLQSRAI